MRFGHVIGRITLSRQEETLRGGRFLLVQPVSREQLAGAPLLPMSRGNTMAVYDNLGAAPGDVIGYVEGREASKPFPSPVPVDNFNCAILNEVYYDPPAEDNKNEAVPEPPKKQSS